MKNIVSFSGGKDSTAMLLMMIENNIHIDEIIFCDTTVEFFEMYKHIKKVEDYIKIPITILRAEKNYEYMMFEYVKKRGKNKGQKGYDWAGPLSRWCTRYFKQDVMKRYLKQKYRNEQIIQFIGIAIDETKRLEKNKNFTNLRYPLAEWGITEKMALEYCYRKGFDWGGLYEKFSRVSCWCCPLQSLKELRILYKQFPELWEILKKWDTQARRKFRSDYDILDLEYKFKKEGLDNELQCSNSKG